MKTFRISIFLICSLLLLSLGYAQKRQVGKATYYGKNSHGKRTSSGEIYHRDSMTCAHRTYPFGTILKVRDLATDNEVIVKVTDRGPFARGRVIDLSYAAARELEIIRKGVSDVEITMVNNHVPYRSKESIEIPQLEVKSPDGNGYCLLSQWVDKKHQMELKKVIAKSSTETTKRNGITKLKKDSVARWKIFDKLCAIGDADNSSEYKYLIKQ